MCIQIRSVSRRPSTRSLRAVQFVSASDTSADLLHSASPYHTPSVRTVACYLAILLDTFFGQVKTINVCIRSNAARQRVCNNKGLAAKILCFHTLAITERLAPSLEV